jgi:excisionase family DNA binding protein
MSATATTPTASRAPIEANAAALQVGIPPSTVFRWLRQGRASGKKYGRSWLLDESDVEHLRRLAADRPTRSRAG